MQAQNYWEIFLETGAPEMYLLYAQALKMEDIHASEGGGPRSSGRPV